eukprot:TRINITY_DN9527_c0_g1_i1.p1 TRINITY_DN9527_c0_g1~~TRINITY_DN9527_c0_g1_i1.p1  ORF type:complete len:408 (+),score=80.13 TRINITY_DN9527_c0_g1_i1:141-1364(+)
MRRQAAGSRIFSGVVVGLPSKVTGSDAEEEWQEVDWVTWSTGDISVESDSFALVFMLSGAGGVVKDKSLGSLARVSKVADETLVVTTSDQLHRLYRFTFRCSKDAEEFALVAKDAEEKLATSNRDGRDGPERVKRDEAAKQLEADICAKFGDQHPLVYSGVELFSSDPVRGEGATEILRGHGTIALLDPPGRETHRVGSYELHFYSADEGAGSPTVRLVIGPKMSLTQLTSEDSDSYEAVFTLPAPPDTCPHTIAFDNAGVAAAFSRDYRVRQRLMDVAVKTVKGARAASDLRGEIEELKQQSIFRSFWRLIILCAVLMVFFSVIRLVMLYAERPGRAPAAYVQDLSRDILFVLHASRSIFSDTVAKACQAGFGTLRASEVHRCASLQSVSEIKLCIDQLVGSSSSA